MREIKFTIIFLSIILKGILSNAQSIPVDAEGLDDDFRRAQLLGEVDSTISFTIRPLSLPALKSGNRLYSGDIWDDLEKNSMRSGQNKFIIQLLPISWRQQYNSHHPHGWNDGSMIRAKGYQTLFSAGFFTKIGPLNIQISPEFVFAENSAFKEFPTYYNSTDLPERFGEKAYTKLSWGQSSIRLNFGPVSLGLSNENLWWGPGIRNSLLMSNSASGFKHLTLNTVRPIHTAIGSVEAQIIAGRLEGSGFTPPKPDDWRYLSAMVFSYHPKWIPGLFLGLTRSFQLYSKDIGNGLTDYFPLLAPYQKVKTDHPEINTNDEDAKRRDQLTSVFARWVFTKAKAEVYFEYGLNDHSYNIRAFLLNPESTRTSIFGMRKLLSIKARSDEHIQLSLELTRLEQSIDRIIRDAGSWYVHHQVVHGYTNRGEVLGAGIGPGSNLQSVDISWIKGLKRIGLQLERYVHNNDFYYAAIAAPGTTESQWVDLSFAALAGWSYKNLLFNARLKAIESLNYQWLSGSNGLPKQNAFNLHASMGIMYRF